MNRVNPVAKFLSQLVLCVLLAAGVAAGWVLWRSDDPLYTAADWLSAGRFQRYDLMIADTARKNGVDPLLIKAVVWRESQFHPDKTGSSGERGLMQVGEAAAKDWVVAHKVETFTPNDLFSPRMNLEIGSWYLKQKLARWASKEDPVPFALAEYNAGRTRVNRWIAAGKLGEATTATDLRTNIDFPSTQAYVEEVLKRYAFYRAQEEKKNAVPR